MSEIIKYGWLTDFDDKKFAPKSLFDYIYTSTTDKRNLTQWLSDFETALNNKDLQVNLASDNSVKFSSPGAIGVTGVLDVNNGGLGIKNPTQYGLLMGNGTSAVSTVDSKAGFLISKTDGTKPLYSGIKALWESLQPDKQGPGFYIGFDSGDKRYYMGEVPLAASNQAGAISTGAQEINGSKTFLSDAQFGGKVSITGAATISSKASFLSDVDIAGAAKVNNDLTIQTGNIIFGNNACILGQSFTDSFFINDASDRTIFYADNTGLHAVEYWIKNSTYDTSFSNALKRIGDLETNLAAETANRGSAISNLSSTINNHILYVTLNVAKTTAKFSESAIGVTGVLNIANGGTGHNAWTKNRIVYASDTNALSQLDAGANDDVLMSGGSSGAPFWHTPTTTNTNNAIVRRDGQGGFSAGTITANLSGNATSANKVNNVLKINNKTYDGSSEINVGIIGVGYGGTGTSTAPIKGGIIYGASTSQYACSVKGTTGDVLMSGGESTPYWHTPASTNTKNALVLRDGSGNFSAGTITATSFVGAMSKSISINNKTYNGSADVDVGTIGVGYGGTGNTSFTASTLIYASSTSKLSSYTSTLGSTTKPFYLSAGVPTECSTYAGGTKVTLNGTAKGASTASFYAPTAAGTSGQVLTSGGSGVAPAWLTNTLGSTTKSIYLNSGVLTEGSTYAGGTAVTLNGTSKGASTASFYAPTAAGTSGYYLRSSGSGAPSWSNIIVVQTSAPTTYVAGQMWLA